MHLTSRWPLAGLLIAVLAAALATAVALPAQALSIDDPNLEPCTRLTGNLVVNCGFEAPVVAGVVPGWTHLVSHGSAVSSLAFSGSHSLSFQAEGRDDVWTQTIPVAPNTMYLVGARFQSGHGSGSPTDDIALTATNVAGNPGQGTSIYSSQNTDLSWVRGAQLVTTGSGHTMTLTLSGGNVPAQTFVDDVFVVAQRSGCAAIANNLVHNCGFEAGSVTPWVHVVDHNSQLRPISNGGIQGLRIASTSADDVWSQALAVHPHTQYTVTYWVEYSSGSGTPVNDLTVAMSNVPNAPAGVLKVTTTNVANRFWAPVTETFTTGGASTATLSISGANTPDSTYVDDFSMTVVPHVTVSAKRRALTTTLTGVGGQKVLLERLKHNHWVVVRSFTAPKTGLSKAWKVTVSAGSYRAVAQSAPGYRSATSSTVRVS